MISKIFGDESVVSKEHFLIKMSGQCRDYLNPYELRQMVIKKSLLRPSCNDTCFTSDFTLFVTDAPRIELPDSYEGCQPKKSHCR